MKSKKQGIEALTIRRAVIADTDKVRYRVYSSPTEFIAVIAESALMAVKVSGISKPHKIVRDLPTEGVAIEAKKMAARDASLARVAMSMQKSDAPARLTADIPPLDVDAKQSAFKPINLGDLQRGGILRARILPPEMLNEIIEKHTKASLPAVPVAEPSAPLAVVAETAPDRTPAERLMEMADAMAPTHEVPADPNAPLSPEEVETLLNG